MNVLHTTPVQEVPQMSFSNSALLHYGGSAAAIIIAISILLKAVGDMIGTLVPVMLRSQDPSQSSSVPSSVETD